MNITQKLILSLFLIVILTIFAPPYRIIKFQRFEINTEKIIVAEWIEFHDFFQPPISVRKYGETFFSYYTRHLEYPIEIHYDRDYPTHASIILAESLTLLMLFFIFKSKKIINRKETL